MVSPASCMWQKASWINTPTTDIGTGVLSTSGTINLTGFTATSMSWA